MTRRVKKAISILTKAIVNQTLSKGSCISCAVGHIMADAAKYTVSKHENNIEAVTKDGNRAPTSSWYSFLCTPDKYIDVKEFEDVIELIVKSRFTKSELTDIEAIFERNTRVPYYNIAEEYSITDQADVVNGATAVIRYLLDIDSCTETIEEAFLLPLKSY